MAGHTVTLPSIEFASKTAAKNFFKDMLSRYKEDETINEEDSGFLYEVLLRHNEIDEKDIFDIKRFFKAKAKDFPTMCFHFERTDNNKTDFSVPYCIDARKRTVSQDFYNACRFSISTRLTEKKASLFKNGDVYCAKTGDVITINECEYRHSQPPFRQIVKDFISLENIHITSDLIVDNDDMQYATKFFNNQMAQDFDKYHSTVAKLECIKKYVR